MKKLLTIILCLILVLSLSACTYNPPEGWTKKHHTYDEVLEFAKSFDPNATVSEKYTDTTDEYDWEFREWKAVINGAHCHVASVSDWVWNEGVGAGEFVKVYYRIDTDYDYIVIKNILSSKYTNWELGESISSKYHHNENTIVASLVLPEYRILSDDELEELWQTVCEINEEYKKLALERKIVFAVPSPGEYYDSAENRHIIKNDSSACVQEFTQQGKQDFLQEYKEDWALLESGLPVE